MPYSLKILWRERTRYLSAVLAVTFSALLIAVQCGLLLGLLIYSSLPIDHAAADIWVTTPDAPSLSLAHPIPDAWLLRVAAMPEVERTEIFLQGLSSWHKPNKGSSEMCVIIGTRLDDASLGAMREITPTMRAHLTEPGAVVVDFSELSKLGLRHGTGEFAEINRRRVRIVGTVHGFQGVTAPYVFCSVETARTLLPIYEQRPNLTMYVLAHCGNPADIPKVVQRLRQQYPDMGVYPSKEFSERTRAYWLLRSQAGTVMGCTVVLALLVGLVVTSQTLYAAALASLKEYAVLDALGIARWRLVGLVMNKSFWIGAVGTTLALPLIFGTSWTAQLVRTMVLLPGWLLVMSTALTMGMALASGVASLRSLRQVEPATLLR